MTDEDAKHVLLDAIDATVRTIERRAKYYRNLVVAVSLTLIAPIGASLALWRASPLLALALTVPLVAAFAYLDARLVSQWSDSVLRLRDTRGLDIAAFETTISQLKYIPQAPLHAMLTTLKQPAPRAPTSP